MHNVAELRDGGLCFALELEILILGTGVTQIYIKK